LNAMFRQYLAGIYFFQMLAEHQQDVAERLRHEALEGEARPFTQTKRTGTSHLNFDDDEDDA